MKTIITFIAAILLSITVSAQVPTVGFGTNEARYVGEDVIVPIIIANMPPLKAISLGFNFNPAAIQYVSGNSTLSGFFTHVEPSFPDKVMIAWMSTVATQVPDGVLGYVIFKYKKFESTLNWITIGETCQFLGENGVVQGVTYKDGDFIPVVDIAGKTWMARNAVFGTKITTGQQTDNGKPEYFAFNDTLYGGYYKWDEAMNYNTMAGSQGICPSGWHVPTLDEFASLVQANLGAGETFNYFPLTTYNTAAKKLKATKQPATLKIKTVADMKKLTWSGSFPGTGESGFNAVGGGWYLSSSGFAGQSQSGLYWTSEQVTYKTFDPSRYANTTGSDPVVIQFLSTDQSVRIITLKRSTDHVSLRCVKN